MIINETCSEGEARVMAGTVVGRGLVVLTLGHRELESFVLHFEKKVTWRKGAERCDAKSF